MPTENSSSSNAVQRSENSRRCCGSQPFIQSILRCPNWQTRPQLITKYNYKLNHYHPNKQLQLFNIYIKPQYKRESREYQTYTTPSTRKSSENGEQYRRAILALVANNRKISEKNTITACIRLKLQSSLLQFRSQKRQLKLQLRQYDPINFDINTQYLYSRLKQLVIHLQLATMSSKLQLKPLLAKHHLSSQHCLIANLTHGYSSYEQELETNLRIILKQFQNLDKLKVRNLLEELDNNLELAIQILEQEIKSSHRILEQKKLQGKKIPNLTQQQENQILKQSFLNLYKKFTNLMKDNEELVKKNEGYKNEVDRLRFMNKMLLEGEYSKISIEDNSDIY